MPRRMPDTLPTITAAVVRLLTEHGPLTDDAILASLAEAGVDLGRDPEDTLTEVLESEDAGLVPLLDGRHAALAALLDGRVLTHRLTPAEARHDAVAVDPDLDALLILSDRPEQQRLVDGSAVQVLVLPFDLPVLDDRGIPDDAVDDVLLLLPAGCLAGIGAADGDVMTLEATPAGWRVGVVAEQDLDTAAVARVARLLCDRVEEADGPVDLDALLWTLCAEDPDLFRRPMPPVADVLEVAGLTLGGDLVAPTGFDFPAWRTQLRLDRLQRTHRLDDDQALAVLVLTRLYEQVAGVMEAVAAEESEGAAAAVTEEDGDAEDAEGAEDAEDRMLVREVLPWLADPDVAEALLVEALGTSREGAAALGAFAETLEPMAPRPARVALRWLVAKALEWLGDVRGAEEMLQEAESLDPEWEPVLYDLARYASDRGDVERGLGLLRRAGADDDDSLVALLLRNRPQPHPGLARNQPCWCGSGRKYKQCHLNREQLPLDDRAGWLHQKSVIYLQEGPWRSEVLDVAAVRAPALTGDHPLYQALTDPLVVDAVLFEGGAFAEFLEQRGHLLPDDERLLAEQWLLVERSLFEVEEVRPGDGVTVRDLRTGDRVDVRERSASRLLRVGDLLCARVAPAGESHQLFGGVETIPLRMRDALLDLLDDEPGPLELVEFLTSGYAPPQLENTEGEPMAVCEATLRSGDPAALAAALDGTYQRVEGTAAAQWHEHVVTTGMERIRASLRLDGDTLTVGANSEARMDRVLAALRSLQPSLTLLRDDRQPAADLMEAMGRAPEDDTGAPAASGVVDPSDPAVAEALAAYIRQYEQSWLDERIPALAGLTPREAADDPTRRPDLIRLLDSLPDDDSPTTMSATRLRAALGLLPG